MGRPRVGDNDFNFRMPRLPAQEFARSPVAGNCRRGVPGSTIGVTDFKVALRHLLNCLDNLAIGVTRTGAEV